MAMSTVTDSTVNVTANMFDTTEPTYNTTTHIFDTWDYFIHPHWKQFPAVPAEYHYAIGLYITVVGITGVLGNLLVIYMFSTTKNLKTPSNMLVVNLALSDLVFSAVNGFPLLTVSAFNKRWMFGRVACQMYGMIGGIFGFMSIHTLAAISYDRYVAIARPLQAARSMTRRRAFYMIVIVWILSFLWSIPPLFGWGDYIPEGFQTSCTFDYLTKTIANRTHIYLMYIFGFAVPLVVIFVCYALILKAIKNHEKEMVKMAAKLKAEEVKSTNEKQKAEIRIAKIAMMVISLFILSWSPYATVALIAQFGPAEWVNPYVSELPVMLAKASAMHNPIVYALSHPRFRDALHKRMPWLLCCCKPEPKETTSSVRNTRHRVVSKSASGASDVVGGGCSDASSVVSNISSDYDDTAVNNTTKETSFSASAKKNPDGSYSNPQFQGVGSNELVKDLVGALVSVTNNQNRAPAMMPPMYLANNNLPGSGVPQGNNVYVVDAARQMELNTYSAQGNPDNRGPAAASAAPNNSSAPVSTENIIVEEPKV